MIFFEPTVNNSSIGYERMFHTVIKVTLAHTDTGKSPINSLEIFHFFDKSSNPDFFACTHNRITLLHT